MIVYGRNPVREALRGRRAHQVGEVWATARAARELPEVGVAVRRVQPEEIERRCGSPDHQGMCADAGAFAYAGAREILASPEPLVVALDGIQDPQNLGAICRTAECAGVAGVVIPERRAAAVTAAVCKASAGAVEHLPVARVVNLGSFLRDAKDAGCWCYGADAAARASYAEIDFSGPTVLVLGAEGRGLRPGVVAGCDDLVRVPQRGRTSSLNASAAGAVLMYGILQAKGVLDNTT